MATFALESERMDDTMEMMGDTIDDVMEDDEAVRSIPSFCALFFQLTGRFVS